MYNLMAMQKGRAFPVDEFEELYGQGSENDAGPMNSYGSGSMGMQQSPYGFPNTAAQSQYPSISPYGGQQGPGMGPMSPGGGIFPSASSMSPVGFGGYGSAAFGGGGGGGYGGSFAGGYGGGGMGYPSMGGMGGMGGMGSGLSSFTSGLGSAGFSGIPDMGGGYGGLLGSASQSLGNILSPLMGGQTRVTGFGGGGGGLPFGMG